MNPTPVLVVVVAVACGLLGLLLPAGPAVAAVGITALVGGAAVLWLQRRASWGAGNDQGPGGPGPSPAGLVGSIEGPAMLFSRDGERLVAANRAARDLLGTGAGVEDATLIQALGSPTLVRAVREAGQLGRPVQLDADVHGRELRATASPLGEQLLVMVADRTEQRRVEELRRDFVVNASHELKTPATAIHTLAEALEVSLGHAPDRAPQLVARLLEESERLIRVVHDLLDLRRLEEPGPLERAPVDLAALVREVIAQLASRAGERGVTFSVTAPERARVAGLAGDLRLVIHNLVSNAVQYNRDGGEVHVSLESQDGAYVLTVADTGLGIPRQELPRIFERFYRVDVARSREQGGTGLGLSIVRHAVERHGGSVEADSLLGEGSTFTVRLPIAAP